LGAEESQTTVLLVVVQLAKAVWAEHKAMTLIVDADNRLARRGEA
jgi:hypothetical protein